MPTWRKNSLSSANHLNHAIAPMSIRIVWLQKSKNYPRMFRFPDLLSMQAQEANTDWALWKSTFNIWSTTRTAEALTAEAAPLFWHLPSLRTAHCAITFLGRPAVCMARHLSHRAQRYRTGDMADYGPSRIQRWSSWMAGRDTSTSAFGYLTYSIFSIIRFKTIILIIQFIFLWNVALSW